MAKSDSFLILQFNAEGQLCVLVDGASALSILDLKKLRRSSKTKRVVLQLEASLVSMHKIYLDEKFEIGERLQKRLWQELDLDHLNFKDVFYDYVELPSSLPEHRAYQFVYVARRIFKAVFSQLRKAGFSVVKLELESFPEFNLWPWRERAFLVKVLRQGMRLFLLPFLLVLGLLVYWQVLEQHNHVLLRQLALTYQQGLAQQVGYVQTLNSLIPAFTLLQALPEGVSVTSFGLSKQGWEVSGTFSDLQVLTAFHEKLVALYWLDPGMNVDVHEVDQHYLWQFKKASVAHAT